MKIFTNGCFDILTSAHYNLLSYCYHLAFNDKNSDNYFLLAIDSDKKIRQDKSWRRPIFQFEQRKEQLMSLKINGKDENLISEVVQFDTNEQLYDIIKKFSPDYIVKGSDWKNNVVGSDISEVILFEYDNRFSTSRIIDEVISNYYDFINEL